MMTMIRSEGARGLGLLASGVAVVALCAACGGTAGSPAQSQPSGGGGGGGALEISTSSGATPHLVDGSGRAVYLWVADTSSKSTCNGACAGAWPPVTVKGKPAVGGGAVASDLGTTKRGDGSTQVTYDGHPLYYYAGDSASGDTNGQGSNGFGAKWWLVAPSGKAVTSGGSGSGGSSSSSGGGYGY